MNVTKLPVSLSTLLVKSAVLCQLAICQLALCQFAWPSDTPPKTVAEVAEIVDTYCGVCHYVPSPSSMPKNDWPYTVKRMAEIAEQRSGREFISDEHIRDISAYYYGSSPANLVPLPYTQESATPVVFSGTEVGKKVKFPLVTNIKSVRLSNDSDFQFLICDADSNQVSLLKKSGKKWKETVLADIPLPTHTEVVDYDMDGDMDIIVSSLGRFFPPMDLTIGKVFLLRQGPKGKFEKEILLEDVPRVLQTRAVDLDGDKDLDIAVAIFGNNEFGEIAWLENTGKNKPVKHTILKLAGGLNVTPADLNGDGKVDLISLISQEYEMIVAMINKGDGSFENVGLFKASNPMMGSTSMSLVDIDSDGDIDVLFTNGDAHDLQTDPKPYHGVQWLENLGELKFQFHDIGRFYGASYATTGDMDNDGDVDIVAASWNSDWEDSKRQTLIWFENDGKQNFTRHNIISRPNSIVSFELLDMNSDKRLDIVAGIFKIDLLKNFVETEKESKADEKKADKEKAGKESLDFKSLKSRVILLENKAVTAN